MVDGSSSIGIRNFVRILRFIQRTIASFRVGGKFARFGLIEYSNRPYLIFGFNRYRGKAALLKAVGKVRYIRGKVRTGLALRYANRLFRSRSSKRAKIVILASDRKSRDDVAVPARALHRKRVTIVAVGVGMKYSNKDLKQAATDRSYIFTSHFKNLGSIVRAIKKAVCTGRAS